MASIGIHRRLRRLQGPEGRFLLLALDYGLPAGPLPGIEGPRRVVEALRGTSVTGVIANPGIVRLLPPEATPPIVVHLSTGTLLAAASTSKVLTAPPERALALGADAVSAQVHFGVPGEDRMLAETGNLVDAAARLGLPTLVMAYPPSYRAGDVDAMCHLARVFLAVADMGVNVQFISVGASMVVYHFTVETKDLEKAVQAAHREFFGGRTAWPGTAVNSTGDA